ncbi:MAG TPA: class I SAM-dependent methyltransferase [Candidatus Cryosericum sp.]|nr:class I SAM-dependent methyltransferase [Candidatus Cryosericum sp.]
MSPPRFDAHPASGLTRPCPLCGERSEAAAGVVARPVRCRSCSLVFVDPVPDAAIDQETYGPGYYEPWQEREAAPRARLWRRRLARIDVRRKPGVLLDVGCGDGHFLAEARSAGWRIEGIEFSPEGARRAAARLDRPVAIGDLADSAQLMGPFDVVTLWHVLEHLPDPRPMLRAAWRRLAAGGLIVVAVPNLDNLPMQAAYILARRRRLPLYETGAREPHLSHFSAGTLRHILDREGFRSIEMEPDRCALTIPKRLIDAAAAFLSRAAGRNLTDAITAFAWRPS